jgi:hypothetical protein
MLIPNIVRKDKVKKDRMWRNVIITKLIYGLSWKPSKFATPKYPKLLARPNRSMIVFAALNQTQCPSICLLLIGLHTVCNTQRITSSPQQSRMLPISYHLYASAASSENVKWGKRGLICRYPLRCVKARRIKPIQQIAIRANTEKKISIRTTRKTPPHGYKSRLSWKGKER